jgi:hypothetical protein
MCFASVSGTETGVQGWGNIYDKLSTNQPEGQGARFPTEPPATPGTRGQPRFARFDRLSTWLITSHKALKDQLKPVAGHGIIAGNLGTSELTRVAGEGENGKEAYRGPHTFSRCNDYNTS